jgi:hypothetical protein
MRRAKDNRDILNVTIGPNKQLAHTVDAPSSALINSGANTLTFCTVVSGSSIGAIVVLIQTVMSSIGFMPRRPRAA